MNVADPEIEKQEILKQYRNILKVCKPNTSAKDKQLIRKAFNLALEAHKDMRRKSGEPYIYHPISVAKIAAGEIGLGTTSVVCALLHDVVEDTEWTLEQLTKEGFSKEIVVAVDALTRREGESYEESIRRVQDDALATRVKLLDLTDNMDIRRWGEVTEKDLERLQKYLKAYKQLTE